MKYMPEKETLTEVIRHWLLNGYDMADDSGHQASLLADRILALPDPPSSDFEHDRQQPWHPASRGWVG